MAAESASIVPAEGCVSTFEMKLRGPQKELEHATEIIPNGGVKQRIAKLLCAAVKLLLEISSISKSIITRRLSQRKLSTAAMPGLKADAGDTGFHQSSSHIRQRSISSLHRDQDHDHDRDYDHDHDHDHDHHDHDHDHRHDHHHHHDEPNQFFIFMIFNVVTGAIAYMIYRLLGVANEK